MRDLNNATKSELLRVEQIGPVLAERILAARPFKGWDEVNALSQIGPKRVANLQNKFCIGGSAQRQMQKAPMQEKTISNCAAQQDKVNEWIYVPTSRVSQNLGESMTLQPKKQQVSGQGCNAKMNLNTATKEQLMQAHQIGLALATDLINARPFGSWDEVAKLSGIGKLRLNSLQSLFLLSAEGCTAFVPNQESSISTSSDKTFTLKDITEIVTTYKHLICDPIRDLSSPNCDASAVSEDSFKTASSDSSMLSVDGPRCFLPYTSLPLSLGRYQSVDTFSKGDMVLSANGSMVEIISLKVHEVADQSCVKLAVGLVLNKFTESHRVRIWRDGRAQAVMAKTLRPGDDVFMSGGSTQKLSEITLFKQRCEVYEFMFKPDLPVESYPMLPEAILTHGNRGTWRSPKGNRASSNDRQLITIPDTDSDVGDSA